jgi:hypothetical protein
MPRTYATLDTESGALIVSRVSPIKHSYVNARETLSGTDRWVGSDTAGEVVTEDFIVDASPMQHERIVYSGATHTTLRGNTRVVLFNLTPNGRLVLQGRGQ